MLSGMHWDEWQEYLQKLIACTPEEYREKPPPEPEQPAATLPHTSNSYSMQGGNQDQQQHISYRLEQKRPTPKIIIR